MVVNLQYFKQELKMAQTRVGCGKGARGKERGHKFDVLRQTGLGDSDVSEASQVSGLVDGQDALLLVPGLWEEG